MLSSTAAQIRLVLWQYVIHLSRLEKSSVPVRQNPPLHKTRAALAGTYSLRGGSGHVPRCQPSPASGPRGPGTQRRALTAARQPAVPPWMGALFWGCASWQGPHNPEDSPPGLGERASATGEWDRNPAPEMRSCWCARNYHKMTWVVQKYCMFPN